MRFVLMWLAAVRARYAAWRGKSPERFRAEKAEFGYELQEQVDRVLSSQEKLFVAGLVDLNTILSEGRRKEFTNARNLRGSEVIELYEAVLVRDIIPNPVPRSFYWKETFEPWLKKLGLEPDVMPHRPYSFVPITDDGFPDVRPAR